MSPIGQLEQAVRQLSRDDLRDFSDWFIEFEATAWDKQLEEDVAAGKLDDLAESALAQHRAGKSRQR